MELDIIQAVKQSISQPLRDSKSWKYVLLQYGFYIAVFAFLILVLVAVFGSAFLGILSGQEVDAQNFSNLLNAVVGGIVLLFLLFVLFIIVAVVFYSAVSVLVMNRALELNGFGHKSFSFSKALKLIVLGIIVFFLQIFSFYSKILMVVVGLFFLSLLLLFFSIIFAQGLMIVFLALTVLVAIPYFVVIVYNGLRLSLSLPVFLDEDSGLFDATKKSWEMTQGNILMILFASIILAVIFMAVSLVVGIISTIFGLASPVAGNIIKILIDFLLNPVFLVINLFLPVAIYAQLKGIGGMSGMQKPFGQAAPDALVAQRPKWLAQK